MVEQPTHGAALAAFLGLGIPFFLYWLCCGVIFLYVQRYLQGGDEDSSKALTVTEEMDLIPKGSFKNYWPIMAVVIDFFQLSAFCLDPDVIPWPQSMKSFFGFIFSLFLFNVSHVGDAEYAIFWPVFFYTVAYAVVLLLLLIGAMFEIEKINRIKDAIIDMKAGWLKTLGEFVLFELPPIMYLPIAWSMMQWLSCNYQKNPPVLDMDSGIVCWEGIHLLYAVFSLLALVLFFPITLLVSAGRVALESAVKVRPNFMIFVAMAKFLVVAVAAFFTSYRIVFVIVTFLLNCLLLGANIRLKPCNVRSVNLWRNGLLTSSTWTAICAFITLMSNLDNTASTSGAIAGLVLLMVGWVVICSVFGFIHAKKYYGYGWSSMPWRRVGGDGAQPMIENQDEQFDVSVDENPKPKPVPVSTPSTPNTTTTPTSALAIGLGTSPSPWNPQTLHAAPPTTAKKTRTPRSSKHTGVGVGVGATLSAPRSAAAERSRSGRGRADERLQYMDWDTPYS